MTKWELATYYASIPSGTGYDPLRTQFRKDTDDISD
jgi:hypothetical protein